MAHPMGESKRDGLRVDFDRRLKLEFHGSKITSDGGLLAYRELDDALGLTEVAGTIFQDSRTGKNGWHGMTGQFRQSVFGRLGGYEDVNDADRLGRDPAMRWIVGGKAVERQAASTSQMGRFETELLATDANIEVLAGMPNLQAAVLLAPPIVRLLGDAQGPAHFGHRVTARQADFSLTQLADDLFRGMSLPWHLDLLSNGPRLIFRLGHVLGGRSRLLFPSSI